MEFPLRFGISGISPRFSQNRRYNDLWSHRWRQILEGDAISDTLQRTIRNKCIEIERACNRFLNFFVPGCGTLKVKLRGKYEDFGNEVLSSKDTPDWKNVEENLQRMYNEHKSAEREERDKWLKIVETIRKDRSRTETTEISTCVEELHGKKHVFDDVTPSDSVETLMSKIELKTMVPKHELVLFCNGRRLQEKQMLKDYDIYTSSILLLRQKRKGIRRLPQDDGEPKRKRAAMHSEIQIKVKTDKDVELVFEEISTRDLILDFKRKIALQTGGMVEDKIILQYGDKELCDNDTLGTYGIKNGDTVLMLHRLRGKGEWVPGLFADSTRVVTTKELCKVAQEIGKNWELLGPLLGLNIVQMDHITEDNPGSTVNKIYRMLTTWLNKNQSEATVGKLYQAMNECKKVNLNWPEIKNIFSGVDAMVIRG